MVIQPGRDRNRVTEIDFLHGEGRCWFAAAQAGNRDRARAIWSLVAAHDSPPGYLRADDRQPDRYNHSPLTAPRGLLSSLMQRVYRVSTI
jgi:hypothetical protein